MLAESHAAPALAARATPQGGQVLNFNIAPDRAGGARGVN